MTTGSDTQSSVVLLGTKGGPGIQPGSPMPTSTLVQMGGRTLLVDAGLGATRAICDAGLPLTAIDAVLITHMHSDHVMELGPLLHTAWTTGLRQQLPIFGPPGLEDYWEGFLNAMNYDIALREVDEGRPDFHSLFTIGHITDERPIDLDGVLVTALRNIHPPVADSFALKFQHGADTLVLSGDTEPMPEMIPFARGADLLVHEAMLPEGIQAIVDRMGYDDATRLIDHILRSHSPAAEVGRIAAAAGVGALALNHFVPGHEPGITEADWRAAVTPHYDGPLHVGHDGMVIAFGEDA
ncbi:MBL fold metallo-hydrolase [Roseovarius rhodophyticola]|uniref:MBL fold metallo-hydrolase n=1 Tax=Roseovarius rhodophyticola TaxID=3080827 RepID=A0ABZ2TI32_9RHOB|nr:MBL fold metallo-hydrolase [Roseovarius sp. W115]MDV2929691.1 MBL fold metallo-hydrolase [Roseovarius sp. W115]